MKTGIIFDFDDTLVYNNTLFNIAKTNFEKIMKERNLYEPDLPEVLNRFDIANIKAMGGYAQACFPQALRQTYEYYCRRFDVAAEESLALEMEDLGWWVFRQKPQPIPGAEELLASLKREYPLILLTKGDEAGQRQRIQDSGLAQYFDGIHVVWQKTEESFRQLILEYALDPSGSWSVGNSILWDMNTAFSAGLNCIYVKISEHWEFEEGEPIAPFPKVESLLHCLEIIKGQKTEIE